VHFLNLVNISFKRGYNGVMFAFSPECSRWWVRDLVACYLRL